MHDTLAEKNSETKIHTWIGNVDRWWPSNWFHAYLIEYLCAFTARRMHQFRCLRYFL